MKNNYSKKIKNQPEQTKLAYEDYVNVLNKPISSSNKSSSLLSIEEEMTGSVYQIRHRYKKTAHKLLKQYSDKDPKFSSYKSIRPVRFYSIEGDVVN